MLWQRLLWLTGSLWKLLTPSLKPEQLEAFPSAATQRAGCRTESCWATWDSWGKLQFSAGRERGDSFKGSGLHLPLLLAWYILIRALAVTPLTSFQYGWKFLFYSTSEARICKASKSCNSRIATAGTGTLLINRCIQDPCLTHSKQSIMNPLW